MGHGFVGKLGVGEIGVGDEGNASHVEDSDALDLTPWGKVAGNDFFDVIRDVDAADIKGAVDAHKTACPSHVISVIGPLGPAEAIDVGIEDVVQAGQSVQILAFAALCADALCEVLAEEGVVYTVGLGVSAVCIGIAAAKGVILHIVFAVSTRPFVVPDVVHLAGLFGSWSFEGRGIDLYARGASFLDTLDLFGLLHGGSDLGVVWIERWLRVGFDAWVGCGSFRSFSSGSWGALFSVGHGQD